MVSRIPQSFIDTLLARTDLVTLIDNRIPLRKVGNNYSACCPFHNEKSPSFTVSPTKQFYYCFGCGASGNAISFLIHYDNLEFISAIEVLAQSVGMPIPRNKGEEKYYQQEQDYYQLMVQASQYYRQQLRQHPGAIEYLKQRNITGAIAKEFSLGFAPEQRYSLINHLAGRQLESLLACGLLIKKSDGTYERFRNRIMFPIRDRQGRIIGFGGRVLDNALPKYLNSPETTLFHKGKELYGLFEAKAQIHKFNQALIVEGYMDVLALAIHGIRNVTATLGTATTKEHLELLFRHASDIIFCFDGDSAGRKAAWRALEISLPLLQDGRHIHFMFLPDGEDPDTLVNKEGPNAFKARMNTATPLADFLLNHCIEQCDITNLAGKASFAALLKPLLQKLPPGVFQQLLIERAAQIVRLESARLRNLLGVAGGEVPYQLTYQASKAATHKLLTPMRLAISLLLHEPTLIRQIQDISVLAEIHLPGGDLLLKLVELIQQQPDLTTGRILEYWRNWPEQQAQLSKLASLSHAIPEAGMQAEFTDTLQKLMRLNQEAKIEGLLSKAQQQKLGSEEKQLLKNLLAQTRQ